MEVSQKEQNRSKWKSSARRGRGRGRGRGGVTNSQSHKAAHGPDLDSNYDRYETNSDTMVHLASCLQALISFSQARSHALMAGQRSWQALSLSCCLAQSNSSHATPSATFRYLGSDEEAGSDTGDGLRVRQSQGADLQQLLAESEQFYGQAHFRYRSFIEAVDTEPPPVDFAAFEQVSKTAAAYHACA